MQRLTSLLAGYGWISRLFFIAAGAYVLAGAANALVRRQVRAGSHDIALHEAPASNNTAPRRVGPAPLADDALLIAIHRREILDECDDSLGRCGLDEPAQPLARFEGAVAASDDEVRFVSAGEYRVRRRVIDQALADLQTLLEQARAVPAFRDRRPEGLELVAIEPGSLPQRLGLKTGDVLLRVGGQTMRNPDVALELLQTVRHAPEVAVDLRRRGTARRLRYIID